MIRLSFQLGHDLHEETPFREITALDGAEEIALRTFAILGDDVGGFVIGPEFDALLRLEMEFDPEPFLLRVDETVGVAAVAVDVAKALGQAAVGHEDGDLVQRFGRERPKIPHGGVAAQIGFGMAFLGVDEVGKFIGITHEEDRRVVADQIPIALVGVKLQGEAPHVALGVGGAAFAGDGREPEKTLGLAANTREDSGLGEFRDVMGDGKMSVGAGAFGVDGALGDAFAVLMGQFFEQLIILHQERATRAGGEGVLVVGHGIAGRGGQLGRVVVGFVHKIVFTLKRLNHPGRDY